MSLNRQESLLYLLTSSSCSWLVGFDRASYLIKLRKLSLEGGFSLQIVSRRLADLSFLANLPVLLTSSLFRFDFFWRLQIRKYWRIWKSKDKIKYRWYGIRNCNGVAGIIYSQYTRFEKRFIHKYSKIIINIQLKSKPRLFSFKNILHLDLLQVFTTRLGIWAGRTRGYKNMKPQFGPQETFRN